MGSEVASKTDQRYAPGEYLLPTILPTTYCLLPTVYYLLSTTYLLWLYLPLPTTKAILTVYKNGQEHTGYDNVPVRRSKYIAIVNVACCPLPAEQDGWP